MIGQPKKQIQLRRDLVNTAPQRKKLVSRPVHISQQNRANVTETSKPKRPIPSKLALTWETTALCSEMQAAVDSWKKVNPTLDVKVFDRLQREQLVKFDHRVSKAYHLVTRNSAKADIWRLAYLYINGGYYSDIDHICKVPLYQFIPDNAEFVISTRHSSKPTRVPATNNALIGARPRCKIIEYLLYSICDYVIDLSRHKKGRKILNDSKGHAITGPWIISRLLSKYVGIEEGVHWRKGVHYLRGTRAFFPEHLPEKGFFVDGRFVIQEKYDGYEKAKAQAQK